jgi:hypothetical protein
MPRRLLVLLALVAGLVVAPALQVQAAHQTPVLSSQPASPSAYGQTALSFEPNVGQADPHVRFLLHGPGYTLFLTDQGMVVSVPQYAPSSHPGRITPRLSTPQVTRISVIRLSFLGGSAHPQFQGMSKLAGKVNYFVGNNPKQWHTSIPTYARVTVRTVYPGIALVLYGHAGHLEYDWLVAPHADVSRIHLGVTGPGQLQVDHHGAVQLRGAAGSLIEGRPLVYQRVGGVVQHISAGYRLQHHEIRFHLDQYDHGLPLTIDPSLVYSTYLGGSSAQEGLATTLDANGDLLTTGLVYSSDFPTHNPFQGTYIGGGGAMAFVTELNSSGSALLFSTYFGGSMDTVGSGIALDRYGDVYLTGYTYSTDLPTANPFQVSNEGSDDAFITKLNPSGSALIFSTYLGGSSDDLGKGIAVDRYGYAYVTGYTYSTDFRVSNALYPTSGAGENAFVTKIFPNGAGLSYSTYLGGSGGDLGAGIAVDSAGDVYVTGHTTSTNFPTANAYQGSAGGSQDGFLAKLNPSGSALLFSTYLGGSGNDIATALTFDLTGKVYMTGNTRSTNFPTLNPYQGSLGGAGSQNAFVSTFTAAGALSYSTYLGGSAIDSASSIAVDAIGTAYITGVTTSTNFPLQAAIQGGHAGGGHDVFVSRLSPSGTALLFSTYLGGSGDDVSSGIATDGKGYAYVVGFTGSTDFPTASAFQPVNGSNGSTVAFLTKLPVLGADFAPASAPALAAFTVTGGGWAALDSISVVWNCATTSCTSAYSWNTTVDGNGNFTVSGKVPNYAPGSYPIIVRSSHSGYLLTSFTVAPIPALSFPTPSGGNGSTSTVTGTSFGPSETVTVKWNCSSATCSSSTVLGTAVVNGDGTFSLVFTVPLGWSNGSYAVAAIGETSTSVAVASFTVIIPTLSFPAANGSTGSYSTVRGTGFRAYEIVTVKWNCSSVACSSHTVLGTGSTDHSGAFSIVVAVPLGWSAGTYPVAAIGGTSNSIAVTSFTVITATLAVNPTSGHAGSAATITGTGFRPGETVVVKWNCASIDCTSLYELRAKHELVPLQDAPIRLTAVVADSSGHISKGITIPNFSAGSYPIAATGDYSNTFVKTNFTIN